MLLWEDNINIILDRKGVGFCALLSSVKGGEYDQVTVKILVIKPTRCTNFSNLFLEKNAACF
jgi:hypothetical protein